MPELPEVETTRRGIAPHITGQTLTGAVVRQASLRWPVTRGLQRLVAGQPVESVERRGKYLLLRTPRGTLIIHLGMSGSLRVLPTERPAGAHDHVDLLFGNHCLRLRDPRRFGAVLWSKQAPEKHPLLATLGPEPLSDAFDANYLYQRSRGRKLAVKNLIMDSHVVVGVGNIYASESLFAAGINPKRQAGRIGLARYEKLVSAIREVLAKAIEQGGTTLRDFTDEDGKPGYFRHELQVYGRTGEACFTCDAPIQQVTIGQRSTFYCPRCQT